MSIHTTYTADFIKITYTVPQIQQFNFLALHLHFDAFYHLLFKHYKPLQVYPHFENCFIFLCCMFHLLANA